MSARAARRLRTPLELATWELEAALVLGRDTAALQRRWDEALARLEPEHQHAWSARRLRFLSVAHDPSALLAYGHEHGVGGVTATTSSGGARFFRVITESFPRHVNYVYLVEIDDAVVLWDCGSGIGRARQMILDGLEIAGRVFGARSKPEQITTLMLSHGHYDHFGDARWWKERTQAPLWIHELDARVLENFQERTVLTGRDMAVFLRMAGVPHHDNVEMVRMYLAGKERYGSVQVDRRLQHKNLLFGDRARVIHTPGHCPGHVCLRIDDVLLVGDQVLSPISPHLSPQQLHPQNGLERYLAGLARLGHEEGVRTVLPAHYDPIPDLMKRIDEIAVEHREKLMTTLQACKCGATIHDVGAALFGKQDGYNVLLALLEAGTHVEYLHQLGSLVVKNVDRLADNPDEPAVYQSTDVWTDAPAQQMAVGGG